MEKIMTCKKFLVFLLLLCVVGSSMPLAAAANLDHSPSIVKDMNELGSGDHGRIYNDAKFNFAFKKTGNNNYTVTVARRDHTFDSHGVQFIYNIIIENSEHKIITLPKYVFLNPGQPSMNYTEKVYGNIVNVKSESYGIRFPPMNDYEMNTSIHDSVFNLKLVYNYKWFSASYIDYNLTNLEKPLNCPVTIRHAIHLSLKDNPFEEIEWASFKLSPGQAFKEGYLIWDTDLKGFQSHPDEYYIQFQ